MISAIELKKFVADTDILGIIVGKLRHKMDLCSIILCEIDKSLKVDFYCTILPFDLIVYLWVKGDGEFLLNAKKIA